MLGKFAGNSNKRLIDELILNFPLPMFHKSRKRSAYITNKSFDDLVGTNRKDILTKLENFNTIHSDNFELKITDDIGKEYDTIVFISSNENGKLGVIFDVTDQIKAKNDINSLKDRYEQASNGSKEGLWEWNINTGYTYYSNIFKEIIGVGSFAIENHINSWFNRIYKEDKEKVSKVLEDHVNGKTSLFEIEHRIVLPNNSLRWVSMRGKVSYDSARKPEKVVGFLTDITEKKETQLALKRSEEQFKLFMKNLPAGAFIKDSNGKFIFSNEYLNTFFGKDTLVGENIQNIIPESFHKEIIEKDKLTILNGATTTEERLQDVHGNDKYFQAHRFILNNKEGAPLIGGIYSDITEQKQTQTKLNILAHYDALTNLPNRLMFHDSLKHILSKARRSNTKIALMFLDLDNFKMINDTLGHDYGDIVLQEVSKRLKQILRTEDIVSRLGGDEFTVILDDIGDNTYPSVVAQKIIDTLSQPMQLKDEIGYIGASVGIALYPNDANDMEQLLKNADMAMYRAKHDGKNIYKYFTEDMNADVTEKLELSNDLRTAVESNQLELYYQPIIDTKDNSLYAFEALARWEHPKYGLITPDNFIKLAEEGGFMVKVGKWIIKKACEQIQKIEECGLNTKVCINISSKQLTQNHLNQTVKSIVKEHNINPKLLELEVTESFLMENIEQVEKVIHELKEFGIDTAIDDFGTGYSSLSRLKKLPISKLKIDKSFIADIPQDKDDMIIANTIITLAKELSLKIVAEGVETAEQAKFLQSKGCSLMQGYLFSEAISEKEVNRYLESHKVIS